jgi:hypothetical protein
MAHARAKGQSNRLVEMNRIFETCDLNRSGGFYRFCDLSLGQIADDTTAAMAAPVETEAGTPLAVLTLNRNDRPPPQPAAGGILAITDQQDDGRRHLPDEGRSDDASGRTCIGRVDFLSTVGVHVKYSSGGMYWCAIGWEYT